MVPEPVAASDVEAETPAADTVRLAAVPLRYASCAAAEREAARPRDRADVS